MTADRAKTILKQVKNYESTPNAGNLSFDMDKFNGYIARLPQERRARLLNSLPGPLEAAILNKGVAPPRLLTSENDAGQLERCIGLLQGYVAGSSEGNMWARDPICGFRKEGVIQVWCSSVMSVAWILPEGKVKEANRLLQRFVNQFSEQLVRQDPLLFPFIYTSVLFFGKSHIEIGQYLLREFNAASKRLPWADSHPLRLLLELLQRLGPENMFSQATEILLAYIEMIHKALGKPCPIVQDLLADAIDRLKTRGVASTERLIRLAQRFLSESEKQDQHRNTDYLRLKLALADLYLQIGKYYMARETAKEIEASHDVIIRMHFHRLMSKIYDAEGHEDLSIEHALRALVIGMETFGEESDWAVNNLISYKRILQKFGRITDAQRVMWDRDRALEGLCNKTDSMNLLDRSVATE